MIPTLNEEANIASLVKRIHTALSNKGRFEYEIIFIDDHSTDGTMERIMEFVHDYPIRAFFKEGKPGKAESLQQGFKKARYGKIVMIDADLQYEPECIPPMLEEMERSGVDVVVGGRTDYETSFIRRLASQVFKTIFIKWMHGIHVDCQSGLKLFKKKMLGSINLESSRWAFDLNFLIQAKHAGYKIGFVCIPFRKRMAGTAKISLFRASWELAVDAVRQKVYGPGVVSLGGAGKHKGFRYKGADFIHHADLHHSQTALKRFGGKQIEYLAGFAVLYILFLLINWHATILVTLALLTILYFADLMFNLYMIVRSFRQNPEILISDEEVDADKRVWPRYTVFCPLYKEWQVIPQFVKAMSQLDYPKDRLQIMLLLEENDPESIAKAAEFDLPDYFDVVIVPHSMPKTKPKALNYGLNKATGEYVVIYDAEDVPDVRQLKKAVIAFERADDSTICVQAKLSFYNPHHNLLTRVFTAEYLLWFNLVLPGMQSLQGPIPLGGTSNHLRKRDVVKLKGWDAFNVTEDCDLGIRLAKQGYTTAIFESTTLEEANSHFWNWYGQRSRWIKGYIQTYLVHMRNPKDFTNNGKHYHLAAFQFIVGGKILSMFINPLMWCITIAYFALRPWAGEFIESFFPSTILYIGVFSFVFGNFLYLYYYMIACAKRGHYDLIKYVYVVPFYWLMMSFASWRAVYEMIVKPHYWAKTLHGLHLTNAKAAQQSREKAGDGIIGGGLTPTSLRSRGVFERSQE